MKYFKTNPFFMKTLFCALLVSLLVLPSLAQEPVAASEPQPVRFDRNHSTLGFNAPILNGLSKVTGKFTDFSIDLFWNEEDPSLSTVSLEIEVESIDTGIENRNNHLRGSDFFDVALYPTMTFESSQIRAEADGFWVDGTFSMHGVTREISFPLTVNSFMAEDGYTWKAYSIAYTIDRTDYGMNWKHSIAEFFLGDEIETDIVLLTR